MNPNAIKTSDLLTFVKETNKTRLWSKQNRGLNFAIGELPIEGLSGDRKVNLDFNGSKGTLNVTVEKIGPDENAIKNEKITFMLSDGEVSNFSPKEASKSINKNTIPNSVVTAVMQATRNYYEGIEKPKDYQKFCKAFEKKCGRALIKKLYMKNDAINPTIPAQAVPNIPRPTPQPQNQATARRKKTLRDSAKNTAVYEVPVSSNPAHKSPVNNEPAADGVYEVPVSSNPAHKSPVNNEPAADGVYEVPVSSNPAHKSPINNEPAADGVYEVPVSSNPAHKSPVNNEPAVVDQGYSESSLYEKPEDAYAKPEDAYAKPEDNATRPEVEYNPALQPPQYAIPTELTPLYAIPNKRNNEVPMNSNPTYESSQYRTHEFVMPGQFRPQTLEDSTQEQGFSQENTGGNMLGKRHAYVNDPTAVMNAQLEELKKSSSDSMSVLELANAAIDVDKGQKSVLGASRTGKQQLKIPLEKTLLKVLMTQEAGKGPTKSIDFGAAVSTADLTAYLKNTDQHNPNGRNSFANERGGKSKLVKNNTGKFIEMLRKLEKNPEVQALLKANSSQQIRPTKRRS